MRQLSFSGKALAIFLSLLMVTTPMMVIGQGSDEYLQGKLEGERDAKGDPLWLLAGIGCGIFAIGAAFFTHPNPPAEMLIGKSSEYVLGYSEGYRSKARNSNVMYASIGCLLSIAIGAALGAYKNIENN